MLNVKHERKLARISGVLMGTLLLVTTFTSLQTALAGPDESNDRNGRCTWVKTSAPLPQEHSFKTLHPEPEEDLLVSEDVNIITGLYTRSYSRQQNGIIDYKTARQIIISEYNEYWNSVVQTKEFPLLYWEDVEHDGEFDMWVDQQGDGYPCDIVPYRINDDPQNTRMTGF